MNLNLCDYVFELFMTNVNVCKLTYCAVLPNIRVDKYVSLINMQTFILVCNCIILCCLRATKLSNWFPSRCAGIGNHWWFMQNHSQAWRSGDATFGGSAGCPQHDTQGDTLCLHRLLVRVTYPPGATTTFWFNSFAILYLRFGNRDVALAIFGNIQAHYKKPFIY